MANIMRTLAGRLPPTWEHELKRLHYVRQIRRERFKTDEPEYDRLKSLVSSGDVTVDVGANVGHYTLKLARLVGKTGRVIAIEPIPSTFALLASNVFHDGAENVTLLNVAASDGLSVVGMTVPRSSGGIANFYQARITGTAGELFVIRVPLDALPLPGPVKLVKIDAEGHELEVLRGMVALLKSDRPTLILETDSTAALDLLRGLGYHGERSDRSPNVVLTWSGSSPS